MKTLFSRIGRLVVAHGHDAVERLEDPQLLSHQLVRDLTLELAAANRGLVAAVTAQRQLQRSRERMEQEAADWDRTAEVLLRKGEEGMTREALLRAVELRQALAALAQPQQRAATAVERMRGQIERLRSELGRVRQRVALIDVQQAANRALQGADQGGDAYSRSLEREQELERCERKAEMAECRAEAAVELLEAQDRLPRQAAVLGAEAAMEEAFTALRARIAAGPAPAELSLTQLTVKE